MKDYLDSLFTNVWRDLVRASNDAKHSFRYPALATFQEGKVLSQRTVVLRKVQSENKSLLLYSDYRTQKISDLKINPVASLLFYNPKKKNQLRISCRIKIHNQDEESERRWDKIGYEQKRDYASIEAPGTELNTPSPLYYKNFEEGYKHFTLVECQAFSIDVLQLKREQHERAFFALNEENGEWIGKKTIP